MWQNVFFCQYFWLFACKKKILLVILAQIFFLEVVSFGKEYTLNMIISRGYFIFPAH